MKELKKTNIKSICRTIFMGITLAITVTGCNKYMDVPLPTNKLAAQGVFITDASTASVLSGVFYSVVNNSYTSGNTSIGYLSGLYTDELKNLNTTSTNNLLWYSDALATTTAPGFWSSMYSHIYQCNMAIDGINASSSVLANRNQYLGEAYVSRAWLYFNLANLYGGVPLAITSDYKVTNVLSRNTLARVYAQIIADAKMAQNLLPANFVDATGSPATIRVRPNKYAAEALLARAYLYTGDWADAEAAATDIINNTTLFSLTAPANTFLAGNNTELIWGMLPTGSTYVRDYDVYNGGMPATIPAAGNTTILTYGGGACMSSDLVNTFEPNDIRFTNWVRSTVDLHTNTTYYYPNKYKSNINGRENLVLIRLAEIYLIRAEARAQQTNTSGAQSDINVIRSRAGLANTTAATQTDLLNAVAKERRVELFCEFGHRFYDLKRTSKIDPLMTILAPQKGGTWATYKQLLPLPANDILINTNLIQNPGYN